MGLTNRQYAEPRCTEQKLLLIDGLGILRRIYEAVPGEDSDEKAEKAFASAQASFHRALTDHTPSHVLAAFDHGGATWRHQIYPQYKESRRPIPEPLREGLPIFFRRLELERIRVLSIPGVEADDVIATAFFRWVEQSLSPVVVLANDKDLCQLMPEGARIYDHFAAAWRTEEGLMSKFGVQSAQFGDLLALMGDRNDDIPGVPGVGVKTAAKLLLDYGDLEGVLQAAPGIPGKLGESLQKGADLARLSKTLVTLKRDITLGVSWRDLRYAVPEKA